MCNCLDGFENESVASLPVKCPVCDGTGLVSKSPQISGDQCTRSHLSTSTGSGSCRACNGIGIVWKIKELEEVSDEYEE